MQTKFLDSSGDFEAIHKLCNAVRGEGFLGIVKPGHREKGIVALWKGGWNSSRKALRNS